MTAHAEAAGRQPSGTAALTRRADTVSVWEPRYTSFLLLSDTEDLVSLALDGDTLWLATERYVTHLSDGVWEQPQRVSEQASIFALAPVPQEGTPATEVWAFGYEGGAWRRSGSGAAGDEWSAVPSPTAADLYSAVARSPSDVWAVGFDYDDEYGALLHFDGKKLSTVTYPWLFRQQLTTIALDAGGELWSGGCRGNEGAFLMRDFGLGLWQEVELPETDGCIEHLSFAPDGRGVAAADSDILWWDGLEWQSLGLASPEDASWVRVAVAPGAEGGGPDGARLPDERTVGASAGPQDQEANQSAPPAFYAVPGEPTWRGYINGQTPWRFDGTELTQVSVDYRGYDRLFVPSDENPNAQGFLDLVSDDSSIRSVSRSGGPAGLSRQAAVLTVSGDVAKLSHPLMLTLRARMGTRLGGGADIEALPDGTVWAAASLGAAGPPGPAPFLHLDSGGWSVAPGDVFDEDRPFRMRAIDMASEKVGWAFGRVDDAGIGRRGQAWRWDGSSWLEMPSPPAPPIGTWTSQLRSLPDGRAWAIGSAPELWEFDDSGWHAIDDAPKVGPVLTPRGEDGLAPSRAPFDVVSAGEGALVGWAATREHFFRFAQVSERSSWSQVGQPIPRGQILDLQLVDATHGWAIGRDSSAGDGRASPAVLYALAGDRWNEIDMKPLLRQIAIELRQSAHLPTEQRVDLRSLEWLLMSALDATNVWLHGMAPGLDRPEPLPLLVHLVYRPGAGVVRATPYFGCEINALSATAVEGGTDVWIMGSSSCGPVTDRVLRPYAGPVSLLRVRRVAATSFLPLAGVGAQ